MYFVLVTNICFEWTFNAVDRIHSTLKIFFSNKVIQKLRKYQKTCSDERTPRQNIHMPNFWNQNLPNNDHLKNF